MTTIHEAAKLMGSLGGLAAAAKMTKKQRHERAKKAIAARWEKRRKNPKESRPGKD